MIETAPTLSPAAAVPHAYRADTALVDSMLGATKGAYAVLDQFGVIEATGADAREFLHNQLTNDVTHLAEDQSALGGYCSPKGRLIASFLYWLQADAVVGADADADAQTSTATASSAPGVRLLISADIREAIQKRLSMFVLRSKVKLIDATPTLGIIGLAALPSQAETVRAALAHFGLVTPEQIRGRTEGAVGTLIRLTDAAGAARYLLVVPHDKVGAVSQTLDTALSRTTAPLWDWLDVQSGEPRITAATQDTFVPQMINFEALGGINFRKGCYPGQEVVARSQYRGTIKRRATIGNVSSAKAGDEIFTADDPQQPCGHVVNVASSPQGDALCLVELKLSLVADASLHVGSVEGPRVTIQGLPYALPDLNA